MPKKCLYYWKDSQDKIRKSYGIELTDKEKFDLARKNNRYLKKQGYTRNGNTS